MNRRSFLRGIIAAAVAPVIIRTPGLIMPISTAHAGERIVVPPPRKLWTPYDTAERIFIAPGFKDKSDPLGQRGYIGWKVVMPNGEQYGQVAVWLDTLPPPEEIFDEFVRQGVEQLDVMPPLLDGVTPPVEGYRQFDCRVMSKFDDRNPHPMAVQTDKYLGQTL